VELALGVKETARRTAQLARQHGQPCAITNSQAISRIEREHRLPKQGDLRWLALALRLPVEQVQAAAQAQTDMLQASRAARAQATLAQRIADLQDQGPLPAGWPLAEQVARRRVELGLNMVQIAQRMRQTATQDGQEVRTHDTTILQVEQRGCIPYPRTRRLLAIALELDLEQVETAAAQQHRKRQLQRASHQQTQTTTATDAAA
jgi:transcriptional regulator with XRE-family HTH domain